MSGHRHGVGPREMVTGGEWLYGRNPVEEALAAGRRTATEIVLPPAEQGEDDQLARIRDEARARRLVVLVGKEEAIAAMVNNNHIAARFTTLLQRLREEIGTPVSVRNPE